MDSPAGKAQDSEALVSLAHSLSSRHPRSVMGLVIGLPSAIMKTHENCKKNPKVFKLLLMQSFAIYMKSQSSLSKEEA